MNYLSSFHCLDYFLCKICVPWRQGYSYLPSWIKGLWMADNVYFGI